MVTGHAQRGGNVDGGASHLYEYYGGFTSIYCVSSLSLSFHWHHFAGPTELLTWHDRQINDVNFPLSFIIAPESSDLLHPSHLRHFLCHLDAMGPFFSSMILTTWLQAGHFLEPPKCGSGLARDVNRADGLMSSDEMACASDAGSGTTFMMAMDSSPLNLLSAHFLQYANLASSMYILDGGSALWQLVQSKH